jgi:EAL domain-containing protein (putative c-di-GMP-specific phosphodiesterase class I)
MDGNNENTEIVRTIMTLATNLGMDTVAEGVETEEQAVQLRALKCLYGQGYLFSKPLDAAAATELLDKRTQTGALPARKTEEQLVIAPPPVTPYIN